MKVSGLVELESTYSAIFAQIWCVRIGWLSLMRETASAKTVDTIDSKPSIRWLAVLFVSDLAFDARTISARAVVRPDGSEGLGAEYICTMGVNASNQEESAEMCVQLPSSIGNGPFTAPAAEFDHFQQQQ